MRVGRILHRHDHNDEDTHVDLYDLHHTNADARADNNGDHTVLVQSVTLASGQGRTLSGCCDSGYERGCTP